MPQNDRTSCSEGDIETLSNVMGDLAGTPRFNSPKRNVERLPEIREAAFWVIAIVLALGVERKVHIYTAFV